MADGVDNQKRALRAQIRERRRITPAAERAEAATAITEHLTQLASGARSIAAYLSTSDEPPTRDFLARACAAGVRVLVPISREDGLLDWAPYDGADETEDLLGMPVPTTELLGP